MLYFDYQTASHPTKGVLKAMKPFEEERFGSLLSAHDWGQGLHESVEGAKNQLRALIKADEEDQILATASGAEAINHVMHGVYMTESRSLGKNHFLVGQNEGAASILSIEALEELNCVHELLLPSSAGSIDTEQVAEAITPRTALISLSMVDGLTGLIQPLADICRLCRQEGVLVHIDATHALTSQVIDLSELEIDFLTLHGEQIHGPKGVGALCIRRGLTLPSLIVTGQKSACFSLLHPAAMIGLGRAAVETAERRDRVNTEIALIRFRFEHHLQSECPEIKVQLIELDRAPTHTVITFPGVAGEAMAYRLNRHGLFATFGGGLFQQIHYLLQALGIDDLSAHSSLSFTFSHLTTPESAEKGAWLIAKTYRELKRLAGKI